MHRSDFPIFTIHPDLIFLDSASSSQKPERVIDAMVEHMSGSYANIHRGAYNLSEASEDLFYRSKQKIVQFLHAKNTGEIAYFYNATAAFNYLAQSIVKSGWIKKGERILLTQVDHHANIVPWQIIAETNGIYIDFVKIGEDGRLDMDDFRNKLVPNTRIISLTGASNVTGELLNIAKIRNSIEDVYPGENVPLFIVDGSQRFPHVETDVKSLGIDFFIFTGHKVFADTGIGVLYGKEAIMRKLIPASSGGGAINQVTEDGYEPAGLPFRHEPGTPHIIGAGSLLAALEYIESIGGYEEVVRHESKLVEYMILRLKTFKPSLDGRIRLLGPSDASDRIGVFSFAFSRIHPTDIADYLAERDIAVRAGYHCAEPLHQALGVGASLRMSLSLYNSESDIDRFLEVLEEGIEKLS